MSLDTFFNQASSVMTVVSFACFIGIVAWAFNPRRKADFADAAHLPFADEENTHD